MAKKGRGRGKSNQPRVGKIMTARDFPCGKWDGKYPQKLGNTGQYLIKILNFVVFL